MKMKYLIFVMAFILVTGIVMAGDVEKKEAVKSESAQTLCPVMGNEINKDVYVDHEGHRVYFCCEPCIEKFKADPDKYLKSMKSQGIKLEEVHKKGCGSGGCKGSACKHDACADGKCKCKS